MCEGFKFNTPNKCDVCGYDELTARILGKNICSDCHTEWENFTSESVDCADLD